MFEPTNIWHKQPSSLAPPTVTANILHQQILDEGVLQQPHYQCVPYTDINYSNTHKSTISSDSWSIFDNEQLADFFDNIDSAQDFSDFNHLMKFDSIQQPLNMSQYHLNQLQSNTFVVSQTNPSLIHSTPIDTAILTQSVAEENQLISKTVTLEQNQSITVTPVNYISCLNSNAQTSCNTNQIQSDFVHPKKQPVQHNFLKSQKIQMKCQPRSRFRPRTENESKTSSHYLRCEEGAELDYPAICVPQIWACQSDVNIIEVTLLDIKRNPHLYSIINKASRTSFEGQTLIVQEDAPNILYFRLTNDDFLTGFKTFMIELIKSKQDLVITKKVIRTRQLHQSMLRFTRIYRDECGNYHRDVHNEEYSCIMTEYYGDIAIEHMGPRYGPMCGREMVFIVLKGHAAKGDLSIVISEETTNWSQEITTFTLNGNVIYFTTPSFPYSHIPHVKASITIYFKQDKLQELEYLYTNTLDQHIIVNNLNDTISNPCLSKNSNNLQCNTVTDVYSVPLVSQKTSKQKSKKRLNSK